MRNASEGLLHWRRERALQQEAIMIQTMSNEWLAQNTDFMPTPDMIPGNTTIVTG
jgi:hypothetical protein